LPGAINLCKTTQSQAAYNKRKNRFLHLP
jgi:hypothetical protein